MVPSAEGPFALVAAPRNARRRRLADGSEVASFTLADALAEPERCLRPAPPRSTGRLPAAHRAPAARPAARRPRRSSSSSTTSRSDPGDDGPGEPPPHLVSAAATLAAILNERDPSRSWTVTVA